VKVLAIGCHPDDIEVGCAGTLARYAGEGHEVVCCHVANGNIGHAVIMPEELRVIRAAEAQKAGRTLGAAEVVSLDVPDLEVDTKNTDTLKKMIDLIRRVKPDLIITHSPDDYMNDHREVSGLVFDASFSSSVPHMFTEHPSYSGIVPIYFMDTLAGLNFVPTEYVDVTGYIETKIEALNCHESQIKWMLEHDKIDFPDFVKTCSKYRGLQCGVPFAEGFKMCRTWPRMTVKRLLP